MIFVACAIRENQVKKYQEKLNENGILIIPLIDSRNGN